MIFLCPTFGAQFILRKLSGKTGRIPDEMEDLEDLSGKTGRIPDGTDDVDDEDDVDDNKTPRHR